MPDHNWGRVVWGLFIILVGVMFLLDRMGVAPFGLAWFDWWPLLVIGLGVGHLIQPRGAEDIGKAVMFMLLGLWFMVASNGWYGLTWHTSWPLAFIAIGASMVARAIASRWLPDARRWKERHHA